MTGLQTLVVTKSCWAYV